MKKCFNSLAACFIGLGLLTSSAMATAPAAPAVTVGIVTPVSIPALQEIIGGFKQELTALYPGRITFLVKNAQGDINIQRSILQQFKTQNVSLVVPIGTNAAQMANAVNTQQPIVALAAQFTTVERNTFRNKNITNILDEIDVDKQIQFIHTAFPHLKKMTLIYSPDDHIFPEVKLASAAAAKEGIILQTLMIQDLPQLYSVSKQIAADSQAIFILKDELVVSGINTLVKQAATKNVVLIASDDGSVQHGADFAVGVSERLIGVGGAKLAAQVLTGKSARSIPVAVMTDYQVYVTPNYEKGGRATGGFNFPSVQAAAKKFNYPVETLPRLPG